MGENSSISWTHHTFNPWWGCTRVSPGCEHCYAETFAKRTGLGWGPKAERRFFGEKHWNEPRKWNRQAQDVGERRRVFCASMADVFEDRIELIAERVRLWELITATPSLDWLLLTKRPENMRLMAPTGWRTGWPRNVWAMTTAEDQRRLDERLPHLLRVPAAVRGLSCEPLLGPLDLRLPGVLKRTKPEAFDSWSPTRQEEYIGATARAEVIALDATVDWVICGGESGHHARPMQPEWARSLRDQCQAAGVAFHFKQWGQFAAIPTQDVADPGVRASAGGDEFVMWRVKSKDDAGRVLDGREWNEFPEPRP